MQDDWSHSVDDVDRKKDCNNNDERDGLPHVDRDLDESVQAFHNFLCFIQALSRTVAFPSLPDCIPSGSGRPGIFSCSYLRIVCVVELFKLFEW